MTHNALINASDLLLPFFRVWFCVRVRLRAQVQGALAVSRLLGVPHNEDGTKGDGADDFE